MDFKDHWNLETALHIAQHKTVDSKLWAEAIEWLLLYGPPEVKHLLLQASDIATTSEFPDLKPTNFTKDGQPCYDVTAIAKSLGIDEDEAVKIIAEKEAYHKKRHFIDEDDTTKLQ